MISTGDLHHLALAAAQPSPPLSADGPAPVGLRLLWFGAVLVAVGTAAFRFGILPYARAAGTSPRVLAHAERTALACGLGAGLLAAATAAARMLAPQAGAAWLAGWLVHATGAGVLLAATVGALLGRRAWGGVAVAGVLLSVGPALSAHAAQAPLPWLAVPVDVVHVAASGAWLGSLAVLMLALPGILRMADGGPAELGKVARAFSRVALPAAAAVVASGVLRTLFHVQSAAELWRTVYGNTLTFKVGIAAGALLLGLYNWKRALPRIESRRGPAALWRSGGVELLIALLVLLVTAVLVALPLP